MELSSITPLILTYNESPNIKRTLEQLSWASHIVVIDSFSSDNTLDILNHHPNIHTYQRNFDTHASQWNYGVEKIQTQWILSLDADYVLSDELICELEILSLSPDIHGYFIPFKYCIFGHPLRTSILPARQALFRKGKGMYVDDGHTQVLEVDGLSKSLRHYIFHDDRKPLSRWLWAQDRYMILEVKKLRQATWNELSWGDRIRKQKLFAPIIIFLYCLIVKGVILDGWPGWYYCFQRTLAELLLSLRLLEAELQNCTSESSSESTC